MNEHEIARAGARRLASAILLQSINDYRAIKNGQMKETPDSNMSQLKYFFSSKWFEQLCDMAELSKETVLKSLDKSTL